MLTVYHNPRCGKSRDCLAFLDNSQIPYQTIRYLDNPPSVESLIKILSLLNIAPIELIRKNEKIWKEMFASKVLSDNELIAAMAAFPILIQRPIVINGDKAVIARPVSELNTII